MEAEEFATVPAVFEQVVAEVKVVAPTQSLFAGAEYDVVVILKDDPVEVPPMEPEPNEYIRI